MQPTKVNKFLIWIKAMRLRTLFLSISCIWAGLFAVQLSSPLNTGISIFTLLTALLLQILSNLANDYGDSVHGADHKERKGPQRAVQSGEISLEVMKKAMILFAVLSFISGCCLLFLASSVIGQTGVLSLLGIGVLAIAAAIAYTNGKRPYGYMGLGDIAVFIFFGITAVAGTQYLQTAQFSKQTILLSVAYGCLACGVLHLNNMRDRISDQQAGKISVAVRLGFIGSKIYHSFLLLIPLACFTLLFILENYPAFASVPISLLIMLNLFAAWRVKELNEFDPLLKYLSLSTFSFSLTLQLFLSLG
jgi:1,4-dihydroxy-2-naphthoate octaprenyltransferase